MVEFESDITQPKTEREKDLVKLVILLQKVFDFRLSDKKRFHIKQEVEKLTKRWGFTPLEVEEKQSEAKRDQRMYRKQGKDYIFR